MSLSSLYDEHLFYISIKGKIEQNDIEGIRTALQSRAATKQTLNAKDKSKMTLLMCTCDNNLGYRRVSIPLIQLFLDEIKRVGGEGGERKEYLKEQLSRANGDKETCLVLALKSNRSDVAQLIIDTILDVGGSSFLGEQLQNCLVFVLRSSSDVTLLQIILDAILKVGGESLLRQQLQPTLPTTYLVNDGGRGGCLFVILSNRSASYDMMMLLVSNLYKCDLFKEQFGHLNDDQKQRLQDQFWVCHSWTPAMIPFGGLIEAARRNDHKAMALILHGRGVGGGGEEAESSNANDKIKQLLEMAPEEFYDRTILLHVCAIEAKHHKTSVSTIELLLDEIFRLGGQDFFASQLCRATQTGWNSLMNLCYEAPSGGYVRMFIQKVFEHGDRRLLKRLVEPRKVKHSYMPLALAIDNFDEIGLNDLMILAGAVAAAEPGLFDHQYNHYIIHPQKENVMIPNGIVPGGWDWKRTVGEIKAGVMKLRAVK